MVTAINAVYKLFLHIEAFLSPTSLVGLLKQCVICWLELLLLTKEDHLFMKVVLMKDGVFLAVDETLKHSWHIANIFEHFLEARLRLKQYNCAKHLFFFLVGYQAHFLVTLLHTFEDDIQIFLQKFDRNPFGIIDVCLDYGIEANRSTANINYPNDAVVSEQVAILREDVSPEGVIDHNNGLVFRSFLDGLVQHFCDGYQIIRYHFLLIT
jgi:hypothetical protein